MAYLELKNITKKYEDLIALSDFGFSVEKNEFAVLFGSSAAGKTTTLRCIAGLEQVQSGEVWFNEKNYTNSPIQGREMAMVFQTFALYPHLTTRQNLAYPLKKKKVDFKFDGEMQPDVALEEMYKELYPFSEIVGNSNVLIMPSQHSAAISYKMMKTLGDTKVIGPLLIGLGLPIEIAPLRSSTSEIINLASIAAYSADVIDYKKN